MQNKQVGSACIGRTFHCHCRSKHDRALPVYQLVLLVAGKDIGKDDQHQEYQPQIKPDLLQMNPLGEEEQDQTADKKDKTNNTDLRPRIGSPHVLNLVEPTVQEEIAHRLDLVYRLLTCQLQIETDIPVSRIQQQSPLVIQDGRGNLVLLIIGIP